MFYKDYQTARNAVWKLLIDLKIGALPVRVSEVSRALGIEVRTIEELAPAQHRQNLAGRNTIDGGARLVAGQPVILYNALNTPARCRFTIAHELGHFILGHVERAPDLAIQTPVLFRRGGVPESPVETAANVFAARLLAPACVLWGLGVKDARHLARVCDISREAAAYRMERMRLLYRRDREFLKNRGYSCFLLARQEQQVYEQFRPFIERERL
ncbi:MAG: ImmA/IrrE family metallo-endopeptidase [Ruminococcaceae bacterium]|nr:ImmA/IrrE family metallo-endopeptidase [Oscillospiraceae bacterium]